MRPGPVILFVKKRHTPYQNATEKEDGAVLGYSYQERFVQPAYAQNGHPGA